MKLKKIIKTGNKKWPVKVRLQLRNKQLQSFLIPQQKQFCQFSRQHGCSLAAASIALQQIGIRKSPTQIYQYAKRHISGYTGSKLTIYGTMKTINGIAGRKIAFYRSPQLDRRTLKKALKHDAIILVQCCNPIHTNVLIAIGKGRVYNATNGRIQKTTLRRIMKKVNKGYNSERLQSNWYQSGGSKKDCGYVIVKG